MAYKLENEKELMAKSREDLGLNLINGRLNIKFYKEIVIPKKQKQLAETKDEEMLKQLTAELAQVTEAMKASRRQVENTEEFLKLLDAQEAELNK